MGDPAERRGRYTQPQPICLWLRCSILTCALSPPATPPPAGQLPAKWPVLFPALQFLLLADNSLYSLPSDPADPGKGGRTWRLPAAWTQPTYPIAFPALSALYLYPGNELICALPLVEGGQVAGYEEVNPGGPSECCLCPPRLL